MALQARRVNADRLRLSGAGARSTTGAMTFFQMATLFVCLVAVGGWANARTLKLPNGVAMMVVGAAGALALAALHRLWPGLGAANAVIAAVEHMDFPQAVLGYLLGFLLFAGAMQVDVSELRRRSLSVWTLATIGVAASTLIVGIGVWLAAGRLGFPLSLPWALVFGALISPTDPVAVLATLKRGQLSRRLRVVLQGEALFNDGVGIVVFTALVAFAAGQAPSPGEALAKVVLQAAGGLALGLAAAWAATWAMSKVDDYVAEVTLSLALAMGVYAAAQGIGLSGPIAAVGAGLLLGERVPSLGEATRAHLTAFWSLIDEILNAVLFFLLGLLLLVVPLAAPTAGLAALAILLVLAARLAVVLPWGSYFHIRHGEPGASRILVWGGLHGALSVALALTLPPGPARPVILAITYAVCAFSVAVQGITFAPFAARFSRSPAPESAGAQSMPGTG